MLNLPVLDKPFVDFFNAYAQYETDYANWYNLKPRDASVRLPRGYSYASAAAPTMAPPPSVPAQSGNQGVVFAPLKEVTGPAPLSTVPTTTLPAAATPSVGGTPIIFAPAHEVTGSVPVTPVQNIQNTTLPPATVPPVAVPTTTPSTTTTTATNPNPQTPPQAH